MDYTFTLKYLLSENDCNYDDLLERLGAAGCDDALVGVGQPGRIALEFTRDAKSAQAAFLSALKDVKQAIPTSKLIETAPDFVGLTDVAEFVGLSRQNMRKLMLKHANNFPMPVHEGSASVWHLADVLNWLKARGNYKLEQKILDVALVAKQINIAKEALQLAPKIQLAVQALVV